MKIRLLVTIIVAMTVLAGCGVHLKIPENAFIDGIDNASLVRRFNDAQIKSNYPERLSVNGNILSQEGYLEHAFDKWTYVEIHRQGPTLSQAGEDWGPSTITQISLNGRQRDMPAFWHCVKSFITAIMPKKSQSERNAILAQIQDVGVKEYGRCYSSLNIGPCNSFFTAAAEGDPENGDLTLMLTP